MDIFRIIAALNALASQYEDAAQHLATPKITLAGPLAMNGFASADYTILIAQMRKHGCATGDTADDLLAAASAGKDDKIASLLAFVVRTLHNSADLILKSRASRGIEETRTSEILASLEAAVLKLVNQISDFRASLEKRAAH